AKLTIRYGEGYKGVHASSEEPELPEDLQGHVFINSFAGTVASLPPQVKPHDSESRLSEGVPKATILPGANGKGALFDGDGMVYRIDFHQAPGCQEMGQAWLTAKLMKPPTFWADKLTHDNPKFEDFKFFDLGIARVSILGSCYQLNTALVKVKHSETAPPRLLVTNDVSRPFEVDPCTLNLVAPVGNLLSSETQTSIWSGLDVLPGIFELLMSSAHPCNDFSSEHGEEKAELFTVSDIKTPQHYLFHRPENSTSKTDKLSLIRWCISSKTGEQFDKWQVTHRDQPIQILQSTHMLGITQNYVIIADTTMKFEQIETVLLLSVDLVKAVLNFLSATGESRQAQKLALQEGFQFAWKMVKLEALKYGALDNQWLKTLFNVIHKVLQCLHGQPVTDALSDEFRTFMSQPVVLPNVGIMPSSMEEKTSAALGEPKPEPKALVGEVLKVLYQSLEEATTDLPQKKIEISPTADANPDDRSPIESFAAVQKTAQSNRFLKFLDLLEHSVTILEKSLVDNIVNQLRHAVASKQNPHTPLYLIKRSDLEQPEALNNHQVSAQKVLVNGAFDHLLTDYNETESGEIVIVAPIANAFDPAEYIVQYDRSKLLESADISDLQGTIPSGLDSQAVALIRIKPQDDSDREISVEPYELTFDRIKAQSDLYRNKQIYQKFRDDPLFLGLYAYRDDTSQMTDLYVVEGGGFPELLTEFMYDLYEDYSPRNVPLDAFMDAIAKGTPMILTHVKVDRNNPDAYLQVMQTYEFERGLVIFSLQFVPRAGSHPEQGDEGYILCTVVQSDNLYSSDAGSDSDWSNNSEIWIFDATCLGDGPIYKLSHPHLNIGMTLHSVWLDEITPVPDERYNQYTFEQDYGPLVDQFIQNYLKIDRSKDEKILRDLFAEIGQAFDNHRRPPSAST
ncbi:MAG: carotenoid oxygenase family protein, partial [Elainellaceae cyanobacterium]